MKYPGPAGIKGLNSECLLMNGYYKKLVDIPCDYDFLGLRLEEMGSCVEDFVCDGYALQDALIMEERQAMTFADVDFFFRQATLSAIETNKYPMFDINGEVAGVVFLINDFFPHTASHFPWLPDWSIVKLSLSELRLVYCKRAGLSDKAAAWRMGVSESTLRTMKGRIQIKTGLSADELKQILTNNLASKILRKKDSFRIK